MVLITSEYLGKHRTSGGAWSMAQMKVLGVPWPPVKGWKDVICGRELSDEESKLFEDGKNILAAKTIRRRAEAEIERLKFSGEEVPAGLFEQAKAKKPSHTPPTNPKSIRRAAKKAQRRNKARLSQAWAEVKSQLRTPKIDKRPSPVKAYKPKEPPSARHVTHIRGIDVRTDDFLSTYEWRSLRVKVLAKYGARCMCCGASPANGAVMHVDHIKPRRLFPQLALSEDNLQVLCHECNHGKGNWDQTDWRPPEDDFDSGASQFLRSIMYDK